MSAPWLTYGEDEASQPETPAAPPPPKDAGPEARRATAGRPAEPRAKSDEELGIASEPIVAYTAGKAQGTPIKPGTLVTEGVPRQAGITDTDLAGDPLAQMVVGGVLGAGAGALASGAAAAAGAPALVAKTIGSAAGGEVASDVQGGTPGTGAAVGAAVPLATAGLSLFWKGVGRMAQGAAARQDATINRELGQAAKGAGRAKAQAKLERIGDEDVANTVRKYEIEHAASGEDARAGTLAAIQKAGNGLGAAREAIDASGVTLPPTDLHKALSVLKSEYRGNTSTAPLADALTKWQQLFERVNGKAPLTVQGLSKEIAGLNAQGFGGTSPELSKTASKVLARDTARVLNDIRERLIAEAAKKNPAAAAAAAEHAQLARDYEVLKTIEPIVRNRAVAEKYAQQVSVVQRAKEIAKAAPGAILTAPVTIPVAAAKGTAKLAEMALAKLYRARLAGAVTPAMIQEAQAAGVSPKVVEQFALPTELRSGALQEGIGHSMEPHEPPALRVVK